MMSRQEFETECAQARSSTVADMRAAGYFAVPCSCGADECQGWALEHREHA